MRESCQNICLKTVVQISFSKIISVIFLDVGLESSMFIKY